MERCHAIPSIVPRFWSVFHPRDAAKVNVLWLPVPPAYCFICGRPLNRLQSGGKQVVFPSRSCPIRPEPDTLHTTPRSENGKYTACLIPPPPPTPQPVRNVSLVFWTKDEEEACVPPAHLQEFLLLSEANEAAVRCRLSEAHRLHIRLSPGLRLHTNEQPLR